MPIVFQVQDFLNSSLSSLHSFFIFINLGKLFLLFEYYLTIESTNTKEGDSIVIPLKVTHPNVNVSIYRRKDEDEGEGVDYQKVI